MSAAILGGVVLQWPIGLFSDRTDRRKVLAVVSLLGGVAAVVGTVTPHDDIRVLLLVVSLVGGLAFPLYSLSLAHANDRLDPSQMVAASSALILANGVGAAFGPSLGGMTMGWFGPSGFFGFLAAVQIMLGVYSVYRIARRAPVTEEERGSYVYVTRTSAVASAAAYEASEEHEAESEEAYAADQ
jgi:MFS family permease